MSAEARLIQWLKVTLGVVTLGWLSYWLISLYRIASTIAFVLNGGCMR